MLPMCVMLLTLSQPADAGGATDAPLAAPEPRKLETVVVGERDVDVRRVAGSAQIIGREELERRELNDVHRVLQGVPGVYVREEDGFGNRPNIGLRGVSSDRSSKITLMEDGVLLAPAAYSAPQAYFFPAMTRMTALEVFKGPASIRYGPNTVGGAINLRTRDVPVGLQGDVDVAAGNFGYGKAHGVASWGTEQFGVLLEGVRWGSTGFKQIERGGPTGFSRDEVMLKARASTDLHAALRHGLELKLTWADEDSRESYLGISDADAAVNPNLRYPASSLDALTSSRWQAQLSHVLEVGSAFTLRTTAYRNTFERTWVRFAAFRLGPDPYSLLTYTGTDTDAHYRAVLSGQADSNGLNESLLIQSNKRSFVSQGLQTTASWRATWGPVQNELEAGARFHHDSRDLRDVSRGHAMKGGVLVPDGTGTTERPWLNDYARAGSLWVQDSLSWRGLLVVPGIRVELIDIFEHILQRDVMLRQRDVVPLLGLGAVYAFENGLSIVAGVHQGFSPVAPGQDSSIKPERAVNSEAGVRYSRAGTRAELVGFWSEYENVTGECTNSSGCVGDEVFQQFNGGRARVLGLEALGSRRQRVGGGVTVVGEVAYTLTQALFLSDFTSADVIWGNVRAGDSIPYIPLHQVSVRVRGEKGPFEAGLGLVYYGEVRELAGQGPIPSELRVPGRFLLDATASWSFGDAKIYATATNLANRHDLVARRPFGARPEAPLMIQVGLKYSFR